MFKDDLCPGRKLAAPSDPNNVCIIPLKEIFEIFLPVMDQVQVNVMDQVQVQVHVINQVPPIFPVGRPVLQLFPGSVNYFQRPARGGTGGTEKGTSYIVQISADGELSAFLCHLK